MRGKAGNTVFVETKLGTVARDRTFPTGAASPAQTAVRNNMKKDGAAWQSLSAQSVQNWNAFASRMTLKGKKSGLPYAPSGYLIFTAYTTKWLQIHGSGTAPAEPPTGLFGGDAISVSATAGTGSVTFTASGANATGVMTELLLKPIKGKHRKAGSEGYVSRGFIAFKGDALSKTVSVPVGYYAAGYQFVEASSGRETGVVPITTLTVSLSVESGGTGEPAVPAARKKAA